MLAIKPCKLSLLRSRIPSRVSAVVVSSFQQASSVLRLFPASWHDKKRKSWKFPVSEYGGVEKSGERKTFLSREEAGLVEISGMSTHERFLCRLTLVEVSLGVFIVNDFVREMVETVEMVANLSIVSRAAEAAVAMRRN